MTGLFAFVGPWELMIVGLVVLLLFGSRLPSVMRSLGQGVVEFKKGIQGIEDDDDAPSPKTEKKHVQESKPTEEDAIAAHKSE